MLKKGDLAQRIGGFEKPGIVYRGKQLYIVENIVDIEDSHVYEGLVFLVDNAEWVKTEFFDWEVSTFNPEDFKRHYKSIISSLFNSNAFLE